MNESEAAQVKLIDENRQLNRIIRSWQKFAEKMGEALGCDPLVDDELLKHANALLARNKRLAEALQEMTDGVFWMSGSADFGPEGQAYQGWLKFRPKIDIALKALSENKEQADG